MKGAEAIARILKQEGVEVLFAYPANPLIDAAAGAGEDAEGRGTHRSLKIEDGVICACAKSPAEG